MKKVVFEIGLKEENLNRTGNTTGIGIEVGLGDGLKPKASYSSFSVCPVRRLTLDCSKKPCKGRVVSRPDL